MEVYSGARSSGSIGSYGFAIKALSEGLSLAKAEGWISDNEAKREIRSRIVTIQQDKQIAGRLQELQEEMDDLQSQLNDSNDS